MATLAEAFAIAVGHHQAGRLQAAEEIYRRILAAAPEHPDALHLLGVIASQRGEHETAIEHIERAIQRQSHAPFYHNNLGEAYRAVGRLPKAVACYRRAIGLKPDYADAHSNLAAALKDRGELDEAVAACHRALELKPDFAEAHNNLGATLQKQGKLDEAAACYRRAVALKPDFAAAHNNLADTCRRQGKFEEAVASHRRALELKPDCAATHSDLGVALKDLGRLDDAIACWRRAIELKPDFVEAHSNLGNVLRERGRLDEAIGCYRRALELKPDYAAGHSNLGNALKDQGKLAEAAACYHRALELKPSFAQAHSNLLCTLHYRWGVTPAELAAAHADFDRRHAHSHEFHTSHQPRQARAPCRAPCTHGRGRPDLLRVGFVSPDLARHPVGSFLVRVLENLASGSLAVTCYSDRAVQDDLTQRLRAAAGGWRDVFGLNDQQLAEQIRADRIDILFDLAGHTAHNRLLTFARKPAPIQITWIGYEGTTGLAAMDYLLADRWLIPQGSEQHCRERVLRMPDGFMCYEPPSAAPPVAPPPALERGYATFGSFNNPAKITSEMVAVWAKILRRAPAARLILKYSGLGDAGLKRRYLDLFVSDGIEAERLDLLPATAYSEYLAAYQTIDVVLDPFPFSGSATTCEALWMGVPVVTCPGETFASRHSLSHLSNVGLTETIARDMDDYVELALSLAGDRSRLAELRAGLRRRMAASPLCDGKRFAKHLVRLLDDVWEKR